MTRRGWLLFAVMAVVWGVPYLLIKVAGHALEPSVVVLGRTSLGALVLLPVAAMRGALRPTLARWRPLLVFTVVEIAVPWLLLTDAERHVSSSYAGLLIAVVPLIGALLAWLTGADDRVDRSRLVGLLIGLAGVAALLGLDLGGGHGQLRGSVEIVITAAGYAAGPLVAARYLRDVPGLGVTALSLAFTAVGYLPFALPALPDRMPRGTVIGSVVALALVCTAAAFLLFFALIAEVGAARATVITYVNPAVALALGVTLGNERVSTGMAVGFPLVLLGSWLGTRTSRRAAPSPSGRSALRRGAERPGSIPAVSSSSRSA